jgi:5-deoxy-glucuronate isomerase
MSEFLVSGASTPEADGTILTVTPESAGWEHVGFEVLVLAPGDTAERACASCAWW